MFRLNCDFPLIGRLDIDIEDINLYKFTKRQLKNYIISETTIESNFTFIHMGAIDLIDINFEDIILGREVEFKDNKLNFYKNTRIQNIKYEYNFNNNININIKLKKKFLYYIKSLLVSSYSINHLFFYQTILYPIFSLYSLKDNYSLVHGSLLKIENNYIVLAGLDGVGKSSLSNELVLNGAKILADNFVLFNGENFIGLNMPLRLDLDNKVNKNIIYQDNNLKELLYIYTEYNSVCADGVYFLSISDKLFLKEIDKNIISQNWNLINNGAGEILDANLFNVPFLYQNSLSKKNRKIEFKSYSFGIPKGKINEATEEILCQLSI